MALPEPEPNGDIDQIVIISPRDPNVVTPPTELQGPPLQSRFIFNPNQPWPPVLATRFFPPPPWPDNLLGENLTIEPVVGPFLALTEEQMETPPGFGRFVSFEPALNPLREERALERREVREDLREDRRERRSRRRRSDDGGPGNVQDWPSGGGG